MPFAFLFFTIGVLGLVAVLESNIRQRQIAQLNAGGNREGMNYQQVRNFVIPWSGDDSEFIRINSGIRKMANILSSSQSSLDKLRVLKIGLMQDLLAGSRRSDGISQTMRYITYQSG